MFQRVKGANASEAPNLSVIARVPRTAGTGATMTLEKTYRRLPLRDLLTDAEKRSRDLAEHYGNTWMGGVSDLRDLSRPVRRKSHYPTLLALQNSLQKMVKLTADSEEMLEYLERQLSEIRDHAKRERLNRN